ncbi:MAG: regulatory protein RecX [bacterium]|nr:regulatory protein RecX [bacterium]
MQNLIDGNGQSQDDIESSTYRAYNYCIYLLGRRYYSVEEIDRKLRKKGYEDEISEAIIGLLKEEGRLDDRRFAEAWVRDRINFKPRGHALLARELWQRGINRKIIEKVLDEEYPDDETELAHRAIASKKRLYLTLQRETGIRRAKGFLVRRGFGYGTARRVVDEIFTEDAE